MFIPSNALPTAIYCTASHLLTAVALLFFGPPAAQVCAIAGYAAFGLALLAVAACFFRLPGPLLLVLASACLAMQRSPQAPAIRLVESRPVQLQARLLEWHPHDDGDWALLDQLQDLHGRALAPSDTRLLAVAELGITRPEVGSRLTLEGRLSHDGYFFRLDSCRWRLLEYGRAPPVTFLRNAVRARLHQSLSAQTAGLALALLLGERREVSPQMQANYRRFGLVHLLAVSGLHFWLWDQLLRRLLRGRWSKLRWPMLLLAAALADAATPVVRACSVVLLRDWSAAMAMPVRGLHLWAAAWAVEITLLPPRADGLGFALSYTATAFLILACGGGTRSWWLQTLRASWAAFLGSMPILFAVQATIEPWTILLSPLLALLMPIRLLASLFALLPGFGLAMDWLLRGVGFVEDCFFHLLEQAPFSPWSRPQLSSCLLCLSAFAGLWLCRNMRTCGWPQRIAALAILACGFCVPMPRTPGILAMSVGHGLAVVIQGQRQSLSFDLGSGDLQPQRLFERVWMPSLGQRHWDLPQQVVRSHSDSDHINGLPWLRQRAAVKEIRVAALRSHFLRGYEPFRIRVIGCQAARNGVANDEGHVLEISADGFRMVLLGDQSGYSLRQLRQQIEAGPIDILLVPHHGLTTDGLAELLLHLQPKLAWTSSGPRNFPLPVAPLLEYFGVPLVSTLGSDLEWEFHTNQMHGMPSSQ